MLKVAHLPKIYDMHEDQVPEAIRGGMTGVSFAGTTYDPNPRQRMALLNEQAALKKAARANLGSASGAGALTQHQANEDDAIEARLEQIDELLLQHEERRETEGRAARGSQERRSAAPWAPGPRFAQMFPDLAGRPDNGGFKSLDEFLAPLEAGGWDPRYNALMHGSDANGTGLIIPGEFSAQLFDASLEGEIVRPRATIYAMRSDIRKISGFTVGSGAGPFGVTGGWVGDGVEITEHEPKTRSIELHAKGLKTLTQIANATIDDGANVEGESLESQLQASQVKGIGWLLDKGFLTGNGAGQPLGILNAPATITVTKETGQAAATIQYENLTKMFSRLHPAHVTNAVWIANPSTIPELLGLGQVVGVGGVPVPVLRDNGTGGFTILTRPVLFTEKASALGTKGDIMLADLSQYAVGLRAEIRIEKSSHVGFTRDTSYYRTVVRADGQPIWDQPYTPANGSTLSTFVVLETR